MKPFSETYVRKKKRPFSSSSKARSPQPKTFEMPINREARVLTRSLAKEKEKPVDPPTAELKPPSPEIHVIESEAEVLKEAETSIRIVIVKKKRKLVLPASSSSSSHRSASAHHGEVTSSRKVAKKKGEDLPIYYARTPHTRPKNKLRLNSKLIDNPKLKDLVINVDEPSPAKEQKKTVSKNIAKSLKKGKARVKEVDGLALLSTTMDLLK